MLQIIKYLTFKPKMLTPMMIQYSKGYTTGSGCPVINVVNTPESTSSSGPLKRALTPGKCRMGFIPDEWFLFFGPMTGVSGPYIFMVGMGNYMASKEILVMEHEYYLGISVFIVLYLVATKLGPTIGSTLDKGVDEMANELESGRINEVAELKQQIKDAETAIWRAEGQKELIEAKKENVKMQLEAIFRERQMMVHKTVQRRVEFHLKQHWVTRRIRHKWMVKWILKQVHAGITPDFKKKVMDYAIIELKALADKHEAAAGKK